jgi:hypothetical protein
MMFVEQAPVFNLDFVRTKIKISDCTFCRFYQFGKHTVDICFQIYIAQQGTV